ncbi:autophagy-related protein 9A isoform X1 [Polypterus senegalus]|uniref:autophagy-related protein 9A isoform X1 n=1 Tax=Polypterus senegalus TaxID=55291 RepID=UPI001965230A|nr:autophagy-related protein 9A isoform X1 [Polypterus senegalus]XP_039612262.1 autophagy-related protein 9A isoform X1 [Polypterus senegalus]
MAHFDTEYQRLEVSYNDSPPGEEDMLVHVPEGSKSLWHHIENLDLFFQRVYNLHQKNGFTCMLLGEIFELVQLVFVVAFTVFLANCVDYDILFANKMVNHTHHLHESIKVTLPDAFLPANVCSARIRNNVVVIFIMVIAGVFWLHRLIKFIYNICCYWEIRSFYINALKISMADLPYFTWQEVQARIIEIQKEHQMCIHKKELTELDIYHRILRFKNYMVAMVNKSLLPIRYRLPMLGDVVFYTRGLKYNFELIFFWGPGSLFENEWSLKPEYKRGGNRLELADKLSARILWIGIANFLLCPIILIWQILYAFFSYTEVIKREPGSLGARCWSLYGRCYLRHFNELDHELMSRLSKGYKASSKYMNCFMSPLLTVVAKNVAFFAGSILAVLISLTIYDEDVLAVEHVLTTITLLGVCITICRSFIPDKHMVFCPEQLLKVILAHIHYMPDHWQGNAHRYETRDEFSQLFQYKAVFILEELLSPVITPFILIFCLRRKSLEIIDFFRNFTVEVVGVGDTCSFAQMDVRQHGHPAWMSAGKTEASIYQQAEDGKTELSLMHFAITNPRWQPPRESTHFISQLKEKVQREAANCQQGMAEKHLFSSIQSIQSESEPHSLIANLLVGPPSLTSFQYAQEGHGAHHSSHIGSSDVASALRSLSPLSTSQHLRGSFSSTLAKGEGTPLIAARGLAGSTTDTRTASSGSSAWEGQLTSMVLSEYASNEMSIHAVYMHELHKQQVRTEPARHVWHRQDSDDSSESAPEDSEANRTLPRSATFPFPGALSRQDGSTAPMVGQRRHGSTPDGASGTSRPGSRMSRLPMGGWAEDVQAGRHHDTVPEEGSDDEQPPQIHKIT